MRPGRHSEQNPEGSRVPRKDFSKGVLWIFGATQRVSNQGSGQVTSNPNASKTADETNDLETLCMLKQGKKLMPRTPTPG